MFNIVAAARLLGPKHVHVHNAAPCWSLDELKVAVTNAYTQAGASLFWIGSDDLAKAFKEFESKMDAHRKEGNIMILSEGIVLASRKLVEAICVKQCLAQGYSPSRLQEKDVNLNWMLKNAGSCKAWPYGHVVRHASNPVVHHPKPGDTPAHLSNYAYVCAIYTVEVFRLYEEHVYGADPDYAVKKANAVWVQKERDDYAEFQDRSKKAEEEKAKAAAEAERLRAEAASREAEAKRLREQQELARQRAEEERAKCDTLEAQKRAAEAAARAAQAQKQAADAERQAAEADKRAADAERARVQAQADAARANTAAAERANAEARAAAEKAAAARAEAERRRRQVEADKAAAEHAGREAARLRAKAGADAAAANRAKAERSVAEVRLAEVALERLKQKMAAGGLFAASSKSFKAVLAVCMLVHFLGTIANIHATRGLKGIPGGGGARSGLLAMLLVGGFVWTCVAVVLIVSEHSRSKAKVRPAEPGAAGDVENGEGRQPMAMLLPWWFRSAAAYARWEVAFLAVLTVLTVSPVLSGLVIPLSYFWDVLFGARTDTALPNLLPGLCSLRVAVLTVYMQSVLVYFPSLVCSCIAVDKGDCYKADYGRTTVCPAPASARNAAHFSLSMSVFALASTLVLLWRHKRQSVPVFDFSGKVCVSVK